MAGPNRAPSSTGPRKESNTTIKRIYHSYCAECSSYRTHVAEHGVSTCRTCGVESPAVGDDQSLAFLTCRTCDENCWHSANEELTHWECLACGAKDEENSMTAAEVRAIRGDGDPDLPPKAHVQEYDSYDAWYAAGHEGTGYAGTYTYTGGYCTHWRDKVRIGDHYVLASASGDRTYALKKRGAKYETPDYGVYLAQISWLPSVTATPGFPAIRGLSSEDFPSLSYDWEDMKAPRASKMAKLVPWMAEGIKDGTVFDIGCFGAHGRTGTLIAMLIHEIEGLGAKACIEETRKRHCEHAIESAAQIETVYKWCGEKPPKHAPAGSKQPAPWGGGNSSGFRSKHWNYTPKETGGYKYASKAERNAAKEERKERRRAFRKQVLEAGKQAKELGTTFAAYLANKWEYSSVHWECDECATVSRAYMEPHNRHPITSDDRSGWCTVCGKQTRHVRPACLKGADALIRNLGMVE